MNGPEASRIRAVLAAPFDRPSKAFEAMTSGADARIADIERLKHANQVLRERVVELEANVAEAQGQTRRWMTEAKVQKSRADRCACVNAAIQRTGW